MAEERREKRWTREEWEKMLAEEGQAQAARPAAVTLGSRLEIALVDELGQLEPLSLIVVPDDRADLSAGFLGVGTPLARALLGRQAGSTLAYKQGDIVEVRLIRVEPGTVPETDTERRQAIVQQAIDKSDLADTLRFALAVDVKWGSYDPEGIIPPEEDESE